MKTFHDIENAIRDYHWMNKEILRLKEELSTANSSITAGYGIEATMPKGNIPTKKLENEIVQRDRRHKTLKKFENKVLFIEDHVSNIKEDRELAVLNCLLDGMSIVAISQHMGFSERKVYGLKDDIVNKMLNGARNAENADIAG
jgi:DNA-binding NarL/FixJ family response regulator